MTDVGQSIGINSIVPGIIIGIIGMLMAIANYSIYQHILSKRRKQYAHEIISLSDRLMK